jgi:site-specific recombinase XerC
LEQGDGMTAVQPLQATALPALIADAGDRTRMRFIEFFAANIRNPNTRRAYARAIGDFFAWCARYDIASVGAVQPVHVAVWIEELTGALSAPTVKQRLAAIRHLFDWLVTGQIVPVNPALSVRGPSHQVRRGKTPVLEPSEARALLDAIDVSTIAGLRDRALIGLMVYSFARIGAALGMKVEDVYIQRRRLWVRLHEKGGKRHEMPCHHNLETYLHAYIEAAGLGGDLKGPLFRPPCPRPMPIRWFGGAPKPPASPPGSATTASGQRASRPTSGTGAHWKRPHRWRTTPPPARRSSMTAGRTR